MLSNNLINILLAAEIDRNAISGIHKQIEDISKNAQAIKIKIDIDSKTFKAVEDISKSISNLGQQNINGSGFKAITTDIGLAKKSLQDLETTNNKTFLNAKGDVTKYIETVKQAGYSISETFDSIEKNKSLGMVVDDKTMEYQTKQTIKSAKEQQKVIEQRVKLEQNYENWWLKSLKDREIKETKVTQRNIENTNKERQAKIDMYTQMFMQIEQQEKKQIANEQKRTDEIKKQIELYKQRMLGGEGYKGEMDIFATKHKGKYDKTAFSIIKDEIRDLQNLPLDEQTQRMKQLQSQWHLTKQTVVQSSSIMSRTVENMGKFMRFYLAGGLLVGFVREIRSGINSIKELDVSLTELSKVSDLSGSQLKAFTDRAYEAGKTIGRTGKEVIDATSEFKRAGYEISTAFELSQQSLLLTNIGDGIDNVKEASSSLIAILKGFKMEASETSHVVDALNEVSNNYAVDTNNLTEIMKRASGTIGQTGTSYEQLLGLATGGFESLRNAEMVASGKTFCPYVQKCA